MTPDVSWQIARLEAVPAELVLRQAAAGAASLPLFKVIVASVAPVREGSWAS